MVECQNAGVCCVVDPTPPDGKVEIGAINYFVVGIHPSDFQLGFVRKT